MDNSKKGCDGSGTRYKRVRLAKDKNAVVHRVTEAQATALVESGEYIYTTRSKWKADGRKYDTIKENF